MRASLSGSSEIVEMEGWRSQTTPPDLRFAKQTIHNLCFHNENY